MPPASSATRISPSSLNKKGYHTKEGRPFSRDTVRLILQNMVYLGRVCVIRSITADPIAVATSPSHSTGLRAGTHRSSRRSSSTSVSKYARNEHRTTSRRSGSITICCAAWSTATAAATAPLRKTRSLRLAKCGRRHGQMISFTTIGAARGTSTTNVSSVRSSATRWIRR
ncbi:MAG: recombinase family protein [Chloroflexi bacterium]|nr:recombinase family protein [Chloroflexota bacterium]